MTVWHTKEKQQEDVIQLTGFKPRIDTGRRLVLWYQNTHCDSELCGHYIRKNLANLLILFLCQKENQVFIRWHSSSTLLGIHCGIKDNCQDWILTNCPFLLAKQNPRLAFPHDTRLYLFFELKMHILHSYQFSSDICTNTPQKNPFKAHIPFQGSNKSTILRAYLPSSQLIQLHL